MWQKGNDPTKFITFVGLDAEYFSTESLNRALGLPPP
jgi:hypothetical protein